MGLLEIITGRRKLAGPAPDRLFAMSTAYVTLETGLGMTNRGAAAIVFQPLATVDFDQVVRDMEEVVKATAADSATTVERTDDSYGFRWLILRGKDFEGLVVGVNAISSALKDGGYGERLLCAVFGFSDRGSRPPGVPEATDVAASGAPPGKVIYWIYNYKRATFYPFIPTSGTEQRDSERELVVKAQIGADLPVEPELERWFPLWGIPI